MKTYPLDKLYQEVGFVAYHFHWSREEIMNLHHAERHRWVREISEINKRINAMQQGGVATRAPAQSRPAPPPSLPPPPPGVGRMGPGISLRSDPDAVRKALAEREAREKGVQS